MTCPRASSAPFARRSALALPLLLAGCGLRERVLFQPPASTRTSEAENVQEQTPAGEVRALHLPAPQGAPTIAYFHGNGEDLSSARGVALRFHRAGLGVFMPEYPGYGGLRQELPTVRRSLARCDAALTVLEARLGCPPSRTVLLGYSLGAAFAAQMAILHPAARLALCAPFTSFLAVARHHAGASAGVLVEETLDTARIAPRLMLPVLLLHGGKDAIVPPEMSATIARRSPNAHRVVLPTAGHNDLLWAEDSRAFWALVAFARGGLLAVRALGA